MPFRLFPARQQVHERTAVFLSGLRRQTDFLTIDSALHERHAAAKTASLVRKARHQSGGFHLDLTIWNTPISHSDSELLPWNERTGRVVSSLKWQSHKGFCLGHRIKEFGT